MKSSIPPKKSANNHFWFYFSKNRSNVFSSQQCNGFTLVELLVVISIIATLAALVIGIQTGIQSKQNVAKANAEVQAIALALEQFKSKYGDYPWLRFDVASNGSSGSTTKEAQARLLYKALTGQAKLVAERDTPGGPVTKIETYELSEIPASSGVSDKPGPVLLDPSKMTAYDGEYFSDDPNFDPDEAYFIDPWDNAYEYFYISSGTTPDPSDEFRYWNSKSFVLLSLGKDGVHHVSSTDVSNMLTQGAIISNPEDYFEVGTAAERENADNIVHGLSY